MSENQRQSVSLPIWAVVAITAIVVAAVTSLVALIVMGDDEQPTAVTTPATTVVTTIAPTSTASPTSAPETSTSSPDTTQASQPSPDEQLQILAQSLGAGTNFFVADGECPRTAAIVADETLRLFEWRDVAWLETSFDLFDNSDTPILRVSVDDYAPNSGHGTFMVTFNGPAIGGPIYGGILGQYECRWSLIDILVGDSIRKIVIGLEYSPDSGLTGYSRAGASSPDLYLGYDPHSVAYFAN